MQNSKIARLFKTFSKKEMREFESFFGLSFLNNERDLNPLFNFIKKYYPGFDNPDFTQENIYKALFKNKKFSDKYVTSLISDLYKSAKYFITTKRLFSDKILYNKLLSEEFLERNLHGEFESQMKSANELLDNEYFTSKNYLRNKEELLFTYLPYLDTKKDVDLHIKSYLSLMNFSAMDSLTKLFRNNSELYNYKQQSSIANEPNLSGFLFNSINFDELWNNISGVSEKLVMKLKIFYLCSILIRKESMPLYYETKELFFGNYGAFDKQQKREIFFQFFNFLNYMAITKDGLVEEAFNLNKKFLEDSEQLYIENNFFDKRLFRNMFLCALSKREHEWAINFINTYKKYLEEDAEDNLVNHSLANIYFRMKDYDKSLEILSRVKFNYGNYKEEMLILKAIVLYEKKFYQETLETLQSFKKTFRKTSFMSEAIYLFYKNSITFFIKFLNIILKQKYSELDFFEQKLNECEVISIKPWLLGKISELNQLKNKKNPLN